MALNKITLTQKNCQYEMLKFYKEHLHPLSPIPPLRHMLLWALQSSLYVMGWQFSFNGQHSKARLHSSRVPPSSFKLRPVQENTGRQQKCADGGTIPLSRAPYSSLLSHSCCDVSSSSPMTPSPSLSSKST